MKAHSIKTDNANLRHKIDLRKEAIADLSEIKVLDLFAGNNEIWKGFQLDKYYGIEVEKNKGKNLNADNLKIIPSLDLSQFNVIDCDSYGIPFKQLEALFENKSLQDGTIIIYTAIGNAMSSLAITARKMFGINEMYKKNKVLFNSKSDYFFHCFLAFYGVDFVREYEEESRSFTKKYGYFVYKKA